MWTPIYTINRLLLETFTRETTWDLNSYKSSLASCKALWFHSSASSKLRFLISFSVVDRTWHPKSLTIVTSPQLHHADFLSVDLQVSRQILSCSFIVVTTIKFWWRLCRNRYFNRASPIFWTSQFNFCHIDCCCSENIGIHLLTYYFKQEKIHFCFHCIH